MSTETIIAIATPPGRGGVGIIRVSGSESSKVAMALLGKLPRPRQAEYLPFLDIDGTILDRGIALFFKRPHSFTGEDILELQGHGSPVMLDLLLQRILTISRVRIARPGEFSERAFLNNKLDLTQAEAIADLINASSAQAARSAINSLQGAFSSLIHKLVEQLTNLRIYVEAAIDFSDEQIDRLSDSKIVANLQELITNLHQVRTETHQGSLLREGMKIVIVGKPNAGKSSLLNTLAGREVAIVTATAGTTRDVLCQHIHLDGMPLHIIDTAGLRDAGDTSDEVERIGIERAWHEIKQADHLLLILDSVYTNMSHVRQLRSALLAGIPDSIPVTVVRNKADLTGEDVGISTISDQVIITISAKYGDGLDLLRQHLKQSIGYISNTEGSFLARRRHLTALDRAEKHLLECQNYLITAHYFELVAEELRLAQQALSEITGEFRSYDLLERIFSSFCIGK